MLTIFCSPKPFVNESDWNQRNALRSWRGIHPDAEIFIFGAPIGAVEAAGEVNAVIVPEIKSSPSGAPSFNAMVKYVSEHCRYNLHVYINCDILLNTSLVKAMLASHEQFEKFLMVGERLDLMQSVDVDVRKPDWIESLLILVNQGKIKVHGPTGVDYFGFPRGMWKGLRQVFMGRSLCDQALLNYCLTQQIPIIDATQAVTAIHQFHGYSHVKGGTQEILHGHDTQLMDREHHLGHSLPVITDSDWRFGADGTITNGRRRLLRQLELTVRYKYHLAKIALVFRAMQYLRGRKNLHSAMIPINEILGSWHNFLASN